MKTRSWCVWLATILALVILTPALAQQFHLAASPPLPSIKSMPKIPATKAAYAPLRNYGKLPISFEPNVGQKSPLASFVAHGPGYDLFLTKQEAVFVLCQLDAAAPQSKSKRDKFVRRRTTNLSGACSALRLRLSSADSEVTVVGMNKLPGKSNYFIGNDPTKWRTGVPTYAQVKYEAVYKGVDLIFYGDQRKLEYDFRVAPGADPSQILFSIEGSSDIRTDPDGHLKAAIEGGEVRFRKPIIYQETNGIRQEIQGHYVLTGRNTVKFDIGDYDHDKVLVVDPAVDYSTYLGGSSTQTGYGIAVDSNGNAFVAGTTSSMDFPTTSNAIGNTNKFTWQGTAFVTEINPSGTAVLYSTYIGGTGGEAAQGVAVDSASPPNVYITGWTCSQDFPTTSNAYQPTLTVTSCGYGYPTAFVTKFNPALSGLSALQYSTYLGGNTGELAYGLAVDAAGNVYVTGNTASSNFPTTAGAFQTVNYNVPNGYTGFVTRIDPSKSGAASLVYGTYLGGGANSNGTGLDSGAAIAVDSSQNAYVTGVTDDVDFPTTASAFMQTAPPGTSTNESGFVARINTAATGSSSLVYSTFLGGGKDYGNGIALGSNNVVYVVGPTFSPNFPVTAGAYRTTAPSNVTTNGIGTLSLVDTSKSGAASLVYSSFFGGSNGDVIIGVAVDSAGNAYVGGSTGSTDFPVTSGAYQTSLAGCGNGFVSELMPTGNGTADLVYSTYYDGTESGTNGCGEVSSVALDSANNVYLTGVTASTNFPVVPSNAYQTTLKGTSDAFVAKLTATPKILDTPTISSLSPTAGATGSNVTISGSNFGINQQTSTVTFGTAAALIISWSSTSIVAQVPNTGSSGVAQVAVTTRVGTSNTQAFTIGGGPNITSVSPPSGGAGTQVTIAGAGFGTSQGSGLTYLGTSPANIVSWSDTQIIATVATGSTTGVARVRQGGAWSNAVVFSVSPTCP